MKIEIDGMAYSDTSVLLIERKPLITLENIEELDDKRTVLKCVGGLVVRPSLFI